MTQRAQHYLAAYAGVLTLAFAAVVLTGAKETRRARFDEIDVQRINLREPDGTLRMVISNLARQPGLIMHGKEIPHPSVQNRQVAGLLFFDDEGSENGGLTYSGKRGADGKVAYKMYLSMDQYAQDEALTLGNGGRDGERWAGLTVKDQPDTPLGEIIDTVERKRRDLPKAEFDAWSKDYMARNPMHVERVYVGKDEQRESILRLSDAGQKPRLQLRVTADGQASIEFLDADGKVSGRVTPQTLAAAGR